MAKVMIDNKIYNDSWFFNLSSDAKWLFTFFITNPSCNLIGCYEFPIPIIVSYTGLTPRRIDDALNELGEKIIYFEGWVIVRNYEKYNPMRNPSIEKSKENQLKEVPEKIREKMSVNRDSGDRVSTPSPHPVDSLQGNGIGKETEIKGVVKGKNGIEDFLNRFNELFGSNYLATDGRANKLRCRMKSFSFDQIMQATQALSESEWHSGKNEREWKADPDFLLRSDEQIDKWLNKYTPKKKRVFLADLIQNEQTI